MRAIIQRVKDCKMFIDNKLYSEIDKGLIVFLGITTTDTEKDVEYLANKIPKLRIFRDENNKLNLNISQVSGKIMVVSNFTIYGNTKGTNRPDFTKSASSEYALPLYTKLIELLNNQIATVHGQFGAHMEPTYVADGPINLIIDTMEK